MEITLPKDPTDLQYEDFVGAFLLSRGYFIEPRLKLREGGVEVLELDFVTTPLNEKYLERVLVDAKSGDWGFSDVFKISGWVNFLRLNAGLVIHKNAPDEQKKATLEKVKLETRVDCCRLGVDAADELAALPVCNALEVKERKMLLSTAWYALIGQRIAFGKFTHRYKSDHKNVRFQGTLEYQRACEKSFFNRKAIERVHELCLAHKSNPNVTGGFIEDIAKQDATETKNILYALTGDTGKGFEVWLQYIMLLEHKARIAIMKNSLDHLLDPTAQEETFKFGDHVYKWSDIFLPPGCRKGLETIKEHPHARRLPQLFQLFVEVFGGFYAPRLNDDLELLSKACGIPVQEIPGCLNLYNIFFPFDGGWFFTGKHELQVMKMIPAISRGAGCFLRQVQYGLKHYRDRYGMSGGYVLGLWHNAFLDILHPELEVKEIKK
jgi:hypothetical protein